MKGSFQIILIVVFIGLAVFGVLVFSGAIPLGRTSSSGAGGTVVLWGTVSSATVSPLLDTFNNNNPDFVVKYVQKSKETFDQDLLEALAAGKGPDMFFLPDNLVFHYSNKILTIPYASYPLATFKNVFAGAGEVFLTSKGMLAFPIAIDPLMMYYNRSILDANGVVYPPAYWDDFNTVAPMLTKKDDANKINQSAVALGQFSNVLHAKEILSALFMQVGNPIVYEKDGAFVSALGVSSSRYNLPSILQFYTDFSDPSKAVYSWNKSFPSSVDAFSKEDLAFYFGYMSELSTLVNRNPNQNFDVAPFPQIKNGTFKLTGAEVMGIAVASSSKNPTTAITAASLMTTGDFASSLTKSLGLAPARRDLLSVKPTDAFTPNFYNSALFARSWLDPSSADTDNIFRRMIEGVLSNSMKPEDAVNDADGKLGLLLIKQ